MSDKLVGHDKTWKRLKLLLSSRHCPQAILLHGMQGIGKSVLAIKLSQAWLCKTRTACGTCSSCLQVTSGAHPDSLVIEREDAKASISIDLVRSISFWEPLGSASGLGKVVRILELELMQEPAQNALLKIIEEPSPGVFFVLTASDIRGILPTLLSRCHLERLDPLPASELESLSKLQGWDIRDAVAVSLASGSARRLKFLSGVDVSGFIKHVVGHLAASAPQDCTDIVAGLREFQLKHPPDSDFSNDINFVRWMLDNLILMMDEGLRLRADLPLRRLGPFRQDLETLARRMTYSHMEAATLALMRARNDLELNLDAWSVLEEAVRRVLVERYVQIP